MQKKEKGSRSYDYFTGQIWKLEIEVEMVLSYIYSIYKNVELIGNYLRPWLENKLLPVPHPHAISDTASHVIINE